MDKIKLHFIETERFEVESSNISLVEYLTFSDERPPRLRITFKHGGVYDYVGVPRDILDGIVTAESVGKAFNSLVKSKPEEYPFEKVIDVEL